MKILSIMIFSLLSSVCAFCQLESPVKWSYAAQKISGSEYNVLIKATMQSGWHIYSAYQKDGGPSKTEIKISTKDLVLIGQLKEPKSITKYEKAFGIDVNYFEGEAVFSQRIKVKTLPAKITGSIEYMTCNNQKCIFPEPVAFSIPVK